MNLALLPCEFKSNRRAANGGLEIEGFASTVHVDRGGDAMNPFGIVNLEDFRRNPIMLWMHDWKQPIGKWMRIEPHETGVFVRGRLSPTRFVKEEVEPLSADRVLNSLSVGYNPVKVEVGKDGVHYVKEWELYEISLVSIPMNPNAQFELAKSLGVSLQSVQRCARAGGHDIVQDWLDSFFPPQPVLPPIMRPDPLTPPGMKRWYEESIIGGGINRALLRSR